MAPSICTTLVLLLVTLSATSVAGERKGKGGKGGEGGSNCRQARSVCADDSHPVCPDGSRPDGIVRPDEKRRDEGPRAEDGSKLDEGSRSDEGSRPEFVALTGVPFSREVERPDGGSRSNASSRPDRVSRSDDGESDGDSRPDSRPNRSRSSPRSRSDDGESDGDSRPDSRPDRSRASSRLPTCPNGGEPRCQDGSTPQRPGRKLQGRGSSGGNSDRSDNDEEDDDDDCEEEGDMKMFVILSVAGSVALLCICSVTCYCCRSHRLKKVQSPHKQSPEVYMTPTVCTASVQQVAPGNLPGSIGATGPASVVCVVGQPLSMENDKAKTEEIV